MTTTYEQLPAVRNINAVAGDDLSISLDFDVDLTGYTFWAAIGNQTPTIAVVSATLGTMTLSLTKAQTSAIGVSKVHWYFGWTAGGKERTVLAGNASFIAR